MAGGHINGLVGHIGDIYILLIFIVIHVFGADLESTSHIEGL